MSFGFGDTPYKRLFCNRDFAASRVMLLRKTPANELLWRSHAAFRTLVTRAKELYLRYRPSEDKAQKPAPAAGTPPESSE